VVTEGAPTTNKIDPETVHIEAIPGFLPLLRDRGAGPVVGVGGGQNLVGLSQLDARHVLGLCLRYQDHLRQCAEAVAFDQNALSVRIKEVIN